MWPRLVANKFLRKRLGSNSFVADFPSNDEETLIRIPSLDKQQSLSHDNKETQNYNTWNVGGVAPTEDIDMEDWLHTPNTLCDIYVLGFQEIVPLRASNVLGSENNKIFTKWNSLIREALNKKTPYQDNKLRKLQSISPDNDVQISPGFRCIICKQMVGIFISVWIRSDLRPYIRHPSVSCVGCGIMGCLGNKGSVSVRFQLYETSFCFVCSHLASGGKEGDEKYRNSDVAEILSRTSFPRGPLLNLPRNILDHESNNKIIGGKKRMECIARKRSAEDGAHARSIIRRCDRIIWCGRGLKQHLYARGESKLSDHRPVKAIFSVEVRVLHDQAFQLNYKLTFVKWLCDVASGYTESFCSVDVHNF
ncbi:Type IV inositol polyphosphate 5-phosphatase 9 [Citrus sinensis]|nr:Type IV inositol polyphosphate 5-phosphatase 9 [Citrus sinensis]